MAKKITELTAVTAAEITDESVIWLGVDNSSSNVSRKISGTEFKKSKLGGGLTYATVALMSAATGVPDGAIATTLGHTVLGVGAGEYRFKAGDTTTVDNVLVLSGVGGRWFLRNQKGVIDITHAGATLAMSDISPVVQTCVNALGSKGGTIQIPVADWQWNGTVIIKDKGPILVEGFTPQAIDRADNSSASRITLGAAFNATLPVFELQSGTVAGDAGSVTFRNLICRPTTGVKGIFCKVVKSVGDTSFWGDVRLENTVVHYCSEGVLFEDPNGGPDSGFGFVSVDHSTIEAGTYGIHSTTQLNNVVVRDSIIRQCQQASNSSYFTRTGGGIVLSHVGSLTVSGCDLEGSQVGVQCSGNSILIQGNYFEANFDAAIVLNDARNVSVCDNHVPTAAAGKESHVVVSNCNDVQLSNNGLAKLILCGHQNRNVVSDRMDLAEFDSTGSQTLDGLAFCTYSPAFAERHFQANSRLSLVPQGNPYGTMTAVLPPNGLANEFGEVGQLQQFNSTGGQYLGIQWNAVSVAASEYASACVAFRVPSTNANANPAYIELRRSGSGVVSTADLFFSLTTDECPRDQWQFGYAFIKAPAPKTFTAATDDTITSTAHGFANGDPVSFSSTATLPAGLVRGVKYYVRDSATNTFKVAATPGGAAVDITSTGTGTHTIVAFAQSHNWRLYQLTASDSMYVSAASCVTGSTPRFPLWREQFISATQVRLTDSRQQNPPKTYATVADMVADPTLRDGDQMSTLGYSVRGVGAGEYYFVPGDTTTADGGHVITHASGRIHLKDKTVADWDQWGCLGNGIADDTARINAALASGKTNKLGSRSYRITGKVGSVRSAATRAPSIIGEGSANSVILVDFVGTDAALELENWINFSIKGVYIRRAGADVVPALAFTGIRMIDSQRWSMDDVVVAGAGTGINWDFGTSGSFIGTLSNVNMRYCTNGIKANSWSGVRGVVTIENLGAGRSFDINYAHSTSLTIIEQSNQARTQSGIINDSSGCDFTFYCEDGGASTVPFVKFGSSAAVNDSRIRGLFVLINSPGVRAVEFLKCKGGGADISVANGGRENLYYKHETDCSNFDVLATNFGIGVNAPVYSSPSYASIPAVNYYPDPWYSRGVPGTLDTGAIFPTNCTTSFDTSNLPAFASGSLKVTPTVGTTNCYAIRAFRAADYPHLLELQGKKIGIGMWVYAPSNHPAGDGLGAESYGWLPYAQTNGASPTNTSYNSLQHVRGRWAFVPMELVFPSDATTIDLVMIAVANGASYVADANSWAQFIGPVIWVGGLQNAQKVQNGEFSHHPGAANPFVRVGAGTPASVAYAPIGTVWHRTDGGAGTSTYVKESGNQANTGWVGK